MDFQQLIYLVIASKLVSLCLVGNAVSPRAVHTVYIIPACLLIHCSMPWILELTIFMADLSRFKLDPVSDNDTVPPQQLFLFVAIASCIYVCFQCCAYVCHFFTIPYVVSILHTYFLFLFFTATFLFVPGLSLLLPFSSVPSFSMFLLFSHFFTPSYFG